MLKGFMSEALDSVTSQSCNALFFSDAQIFFSGIQGEGDGYLFAFRKRSIRWGFYSDNGEEKLARFESSACFKVGSVDFINGL